MNKKTLSAVLLLLAAAALLLFACRVFAASDVTFAWDPNTEPDLAGYRMYQSSTPGTYNKATGKVYEGRANTCIVSGIADGTHYFVVTAYDTRGNESGFSNEVTLTLDTTPPTYPKNLTTVNVRITVHMRDGRPVIVATATTGS